MPVTCQGRRVVAVIDQIRAIAKERLQRPIGMLPEEQMAAVEQALCEILDWYEYRTRISYS